MKNKILNLKFIIAAVFVVGAMFIFHSCEDDDKLELPATCFDGALNGDETGVDCGGSCQPCPTCDDGIMNGNELGVDCGGPDCEACPETCDDGILNNGEEEIDCGGPNCDPCADPNAAVISRVYNYQSLGIDFFHTFEADDTFEGLDADNDGDNAVDENQGADLPMLSIGVPDPVDPTSLVGRYNRPEGLISDGFSDFKFAVNGDIGTNIGDITTINLSVYTPAGTITSTSGGSVAPTAEIIFIARNDPNPNFWEHWTILTQQLTLTDEWEDLTFDASGVQAAMEGLGVQYDQIAIRLGGFNHQESATFYIRDFVASNLDVVASASFLNDQGVNIDPINDADNAVDENQGADLPIMSFGVIAPDQTNSGRYNRPEGLISDGFSDFKFAVNDGDPYTFGDTAKFSLEIYTPDGTITSTSGGSVAPTAEIICIARNDPNPNFWEHWTILTQQLTSTDEWETVVFDASGVQAAMEGLGVQYDQIVIRLGGFNHQESATFYVRNFNWYNE